MSKPLSFFQDLARERYGREVVFVAQVGSLNYNLETEDSDEDYEMFLLPNFDDLYNRRQLAKQFTVDDVDLKVFYITHLAHQLEKSNPNFLQLLFSRNVVYIHPEFQWLLNEREELARANLPRFYDSMKGMYYEGRQRLEKSQLQKQLNGKALLQVVRVSQFLRRYEEDFFKSYSSAMTYNDYERNKLIPLKKGLDPKTGLPLTQEQVEKLMSDAASLLQYYEYRYRRKDVDHAVLHHYAQRMQSAVERLLLQQYKD